METSFRMEGRNECKEHIECNALYFMEKYVKCYLLCRSALFDEGGFGAGTSTSRSTNPFDDPAEDLSFNEIRQQQQQIIRG